MSTYRVQSGALFAVLAGFIFLLGWAMFVLTIYAFWTSNITLMCFAAGWWIVSAISEFRKNKEVFGWGHAISIAGSIIVAYGLTQHNLWLVIIGAIMMIRLVFSED